MTNIDAGKPGANPHGSNGRKLVLAGTVLFCISILFPVWAGVMAERFVPRQLGYVDVPLAFALFVFAIQIDRKFKTRVTRRQSQLGCDDRGPRMA